MRVLTTLKLLATAGLGAGYLAVASMAEHPRVDAEYDAHFLHRSADCWVPRAVRAGEPAPLPPVIEIGKIGYPETCRFLRIGWYIPEDWGAWYACDERHVASAAPARRAAPSSSRSARLPRPTRRSLSASC